MAGRVRRVCSPMLSRCRSGDGKPVLLAGCLNKAARLVNTRSGGPDTDGPV